MTVINGTHAGRFGKVMKCSRGSVDLCTDMGEVISVSKINVYHSEDAPSVFPNVMNFQMGDLVRVDNYITGIVVRVYKHFVEYVTNQNELKKANNQDLMKIDKTQRSTTSASNKKITRNSIVQVVKGRKKGCFLKVKEIYHDYLFMSEPNELSLHQNWV